MLLEIMVYLSFVLVDANSGGHGLQNPNDYLETPTLPTTFELAFTDKSLEFLQVWKPI
jgi:hypothetical protein